MDEDLEQIKQKFLRECGACDFGLVEYGCTCPEGDHRPVMLRLVEEVQRLRDEARRRLSPRRAAAGRGAAYQEELSARRKAGEQV